MPCQLGWGYTSERIVEKVQTRQVFDLYVLGLKCDYSFVAAHILQTMANKYA